MINQESIQISQELKKLTGVTELLKKTWQIYKENFGTLIKTAIIPLGLFWLINIFQPFSFSLKTILFFVVSIILGIFLFAWLNASLIFIIKNRENRISAKEGLKIGLQKAIPLFWIGILSSIIIYSGMIFLIIPGIILTIWFCLASYVLVYEDKRGMNALLKSRDLVKGYWWSVLWRMIVISGIGLIIFLPFFSLSFLFPNLYQYPYIFPIFYMLSLLFLFPVNISFFALIYEDLAAIKSKVSFREPTLKRKLKYILMPGILIGILIILLILIIIGTKGIVKDHPGYQRYLLDIHPVETCIEMYFIDKGKYPGTAGSNQWEILDLELKRYLYKELPPANSTYEYWVSEDNQKHILKTTFETYQSILIDDIDGYPLGENAVYCGIQGE